MTTPVEDEVLTFDLVGQETKFHIPDFGQLAMVQHQGKLLTRDGINANEASRALTLVYRSIRSWFAEEADKDRFDDLLADGDVRIETALQQMMTAIKAEEKTKAPTTGPVVRRGRPRKSASKTA